MKILKEVYCIDQKNILYSPIGTDLSIFRFDQDSRTELRKKSGLQDDDIVILYTGKLNVRKRPHLILDAIRQIEREITGRLYLFFLGPVDQYYFEQYFNIDFTNINIHVKILPAVPVIELYKWYSMADFAVFPRENTLSALDAQACRLPVIMESDLTNEERLKLGGLTYKKDSISDLSQKILEVITQPELLKKLGTKGEKNIKMNYDYRNIVRKMESDLGFGNL